MNEIKVIYKIVLNEISKIMDEDISMMNLEFSGFKFSRISLMSSSGKIVIDIEGLKFERCENFLKDFFSLLSNKIFKKHLNLKGFNKESTLYVTKDIL